MQVIYTLFVQFIRSGGSGERNGLEKPREVIQLLATLAATVAYQAGVDPPGGVWADSGEGHIVETQSS